MTVLTQHAPGTFCWPELATTDQNAAKKFYGTLFGWTAKDHEMGPDGVYTIFQKNGNDVAALYTLMPDQRKNGVPPNWGSYVSVPNVDQAIEKAKQLGGTLLMGPQDVMDHGRMAVLQDPTGAVFSVWQAKNHIGATVLDEPNALNWTELLTSDVKKAGDFYTKLIGWKTADMPMPHGTYTLLKRSDGANAGGMMPITKEMGAVPPHWMIYFQVEDLKATLDKAQKAGARLMMPATEVPDIGTFAILKDPQGAAFSVIQPV